ncbi:MAG TPA: hypothetical protein VN962_23045 [Polyangia bacterium]|nr:hypothetical protein [Polyangia bacterium]
METGSDDLGRPASRAAAGAQGVVHAFVEMSELRRIMGRLAAIEILRMMLDADAPAT